jgi:uncharacterized membrane-anchored protein
MRKPILAALLALLIALPSLADEPAGDHAAEIQKFVSTLHFKSGTVALPKAKATLKLGEGMRFLDETDAERVLTELWGNPPGNDALGMIRPSESALTDGVSYAVVVTYNDAGYVSDAEASSIDYDKILKDMQEETHDANPERERAGYGAVELTGWAERPHYDNATKKIYWAKQLKFAGESHDTVNYDVRVLGRGGYLSLNAVANMEHLDAIRAGMPTVIQGADFDAGARYADYQPGSDKLAAYGLAALVAGGVAAKAGLFGKLFAVLLAAKKLLVVLALGIAAAFKKIVGMFKRKEA